MATSKKKAKKSQIADQRETAKAGMVSSLAALLLSGFFKFRGAKPLHLWAGCALLGFSIWHHYLSKRKG